MATQCTGGSGTCYAVQFEGFAQITDEAGPCTPGDVMVESVISAATVHDTGSTAPLEGVYTVGICIVGSTPDFILLTPNFQLNTSTFLTYATPATGIARTTSSSQAVVSTELSGDVTTSGSNATTVAKIAGVSVGTPTGTGNVVFSGSPTLVTPTLGAALATSVTATGLLSGAKYATATNCQSAASPAVCGSAAAGMVVVAASAATVVVDTTAVTANSEIFVQEDTTLGTALSVTCNTSNVTPTPYVSARTAATSFTITVSGSVTTNPLCLTYRIIN